MAFNFHISAPGERSYLYKSKSFTYSRFCFLLVEILSLESLPVTQIVILGILKNFANRIFVNYCEEDIPSVFVAHLFFYGASDDKQKIGCKHPTKMPMIKRDAEKGTEETLKYAGEGWMSNCLSHHVTFTNFILSIA